MSEQGKANDASASKAKPRPEGRVSERLREADVSTIRDLNRARRPTHE
jgi:hypothetical protein